jgi:D-alanyl-lipoteichoic acid acyltransferase DltB (MBOAT superfamily)
VLFNSHVFLFAFLPLALLGWWGLSRWPTVRLGFLAVASYVFYGWWNWRFVPLLLTTTAVDYAAGHAIVRTEGERGRRAWLVGALTINVALLGYFKYVGFFLHSANGAGGFLGAGHPFPALRVLLPIGISFYTFNSMSYTIDIFRRRVRPADSVVQYAAFVSMFPHLIAGPIVRFADIEGQLRRLRPRLTSELTATGLFFLGAGLVKKVIVADTLAPHVDRLFAGHAHLGLVSGWAAALGYALQLYFDFSGYSDMAVGLAFLLGFRFPQNFNSPYKAQSISDFWRRWHITLSFWFRDYVFIPLGGSRHGRLRTVRNLAITMLLGGLWHGAAFTFLVWGLLHGAYLIVHNVLRGAGLTPRSAAVNRVITFVAVVAGFVVFRAPSLGAAGDVLAAMTGARGLGTAGVGAGLAAGIAALVAFVNLAPNTWELRLAWRPVYGLALGLAAAAAILMISGPTPFLYFRF